MKDTIMSGVGTPLIVFAVAGMIIESALPISIDARQIVFAVCVAAAGVGFVVCALRFVMIWMSGEE